MFSILLKPKSFFALAVFAGASFVCAPSFAQDAVIDAPIEVETFVPTPSETFLDVPGAEDENLFYDADALVPTGEIGLKGGPRKINPAVEPASKYIVVRKNHSAGSRQANLVSAERAMSLGRYDSALELYNNLYAKNKRDPNILLGRATALQKTGQDEAAIQAYEQLIDLRPNNVEAQVNMLGLLGQRYPAVALRRLLDLSDKHSQNIGVIAQIAVIQAALGRYDESVRYLGMAAGIEPQNASHMYNMAVVADRSGNKKEAIQYYEQALEIDTVYGGGRTIPREAVFQRLSRLR